MSREAWEELVECCDKGALATVSSHWYPVILWAADRLALAEKIVGYARHKLPCDTLITGGGCTCGLDAALRELEGKNG